jgi:SAM-dependent methyltransferase
MMELILAGRVDQAVYGFINRLKGVDLDFVSLAQLGLSSTRSVFYCDSGGPDLLRIFQKIEIPEGSRILDYGSGKGGAAMTLARLPFAEVTGIELSPALVDVARTNTARLGLKRIQFLCADAGEVADLDRFTHFYMYNPFPAVVVQQVMANITASLGRNPRGVTLVYCNPVCHEVILASGLFSQTAEIQLRSKMHPWFVYRHEK